MSIRIKIKDKGFDGAVKTLKALGKYQVSAGVFDPNRVDIGSYQEFGTATIPVRSFIRAPWDAAHAGVDRTVVKAIRTIAKVQTMDAIEPALDDVGQYLEDLFRSAIDNFIPPPNAPSTVERKGFDHPLIETGELREVITHKTIKK